MKIVFFTGAGVSRESGIQTFRDSDGLWEGYDVMEVASTQGWQKDRSKVLKFYNERRGQLDTVEPNLAHKLIAELEKEHQVVVITQNVDDLHERGGSTHVLHLHGELRKMCSSMDKEKTLPYDKDINIGDKHEDGSQLRPYIVWFGESVPLIEDAIEHVGNADAFVVVGSTLEVYPAAGLAQCTKADCKLFYIDPKPTDEYPGIEYFTTIKKVATEGMKDLLDLLK
jgi:NAD-dependent deacetylase